MTLGAKPVAGDKMPELSTAIEEYKLLTEEFRFLMTRCMQAGALCLAISGFAAKLISDTKSAETALLLAVLTFVLNSGIFYVAHHFRSMIYHVLNRLVFLSEQLGTQQPHPVMWGYYTWVVVFGLIQIALAALLVLCMQRM